MFSVFFVVNFDLSSRLAGLFLDLLEVDSVRRLRNVQLEREKCAEDFNRKERKEHKEAYERERGHSLGTAPGAAIGRTCSDQFSASGNGRLDRLFHGFFFAFFAFFAVI